MLQQMKYEVSPTLARDIESYLYRSATSFGAYLDIGTLKGRLQQAARMFCVNLKPQTPVVLTDEEKNYRALWSMFTRELIR